MPARLNIPPVTRFLLVTLIAFTLLYNAIRYRQTALAKVATADEQQTASVFSKAQVPYLTIIPQTCLYYPWVFFLAALVEANIFTLLFSVVTVFYCGRYLERAWGSAEFIKFLLLAGVIPNIITAFAYVFFSALTQNEAWGLIVINGTSALISAFLVAFKQLVPEHTVTIFRGILKFRIKHFPFLFQIVSFTLSLFTRNPTIFLLSTTAFLTSFTYLRFYARQPLSLPSNSQSSTPTTIKGDPSETFSFASFFPDVLQPPVALIANTVYTIFVTLHICTPFSVADIETGNQQASARGAAGLPNLLNSGRGGRGGSGKREEAERRRALALKALDARLHAAQASRAAAASSSGNGPSTRGEGSSSS